MLNTVVCIAIIAVTLLGGYGVQRWIKYREDTSRFRIDPDRIVTLTFSGGYNGYNYFGFSTEDKEDHQAFVDCLKAVEKNNRNASTEIEAPPHYYEFNFLLDNGMCLEYEYRVYFTSDGSNNYIMNDPFDEFFSRPSIQEKMDAVREYYR